MCVCGSNTVGSKKTIYEPILSQSDVQLLIRLSSDAIDRSRLIKIICRWSDLASHKQNICRHTHCVHTTAFSTTDKFSNSSTLRVCFFPPAPTHRCVLLLPNFSRPDLWRRYARPLARARIHCGWDSLAAADYHSAVFLAIGAPGYKTRAIADLGHHLWFLRSPTSLPTLVYSPLSPGVVYVFFPHSNCDNPTWSVFTSDFLRSFLIFAFFAFLSLSSKMDATQIEINIRSVLGTSSEMTFEELRRSFFELTFEKLPAGYCSTEQILDKMKDQVFVQR